MKKIFLLGILGCLFAFQQAYAQTDSIGDAHELKNVVVKATNGVKAKSRVDNTELIGKGQLIRAACCNLGESFTANPSVDVSYSDFANVNWQIQNLQLEKKYRSGCDSRAIFFVMQKFRHLWLANFFTDYILPLPPQYLHFPVPPQVRHFPLLQ